MEKIILKSRNEEELKQKIEKILTLGEDETYRIKILKYPKKILFINIEGEYEIEFGKKSEFEIFDKKIEKSYRNEIVENNFSKKNVEKEKIKKVILKENKENFSKRNNNLKNEFKTETKKNIDTNIDKIRGFLKEFIVNTKLDVKIINIIKQSNDKYLVLLDGKDMRFLIGEKGNTLNSFEYLLSTVKKFKNIKIIVDSNNYKEKREKSLREFARKKGKFVLLTKNSVKLNPMSARERKIIHEEISFMKGLQTQSFGEEPKRYLIIKKIENEKKY